MKNSSIKEDLEEKDMKQSEEKDLEKDNENKVEEIKEEVEKKEKIEEASEESIEEKHKKETKFKKSEKKEKNIKKELKEMDEPKKKNKWIAPLIITVVIIILALFMSTIFALLNINNNNIVSGVSISGIDVSGLSKEEAKAKIETIYNEKKEKEISIKYQEYETTLNPTLLEVKYEVEKAIDEANSIGKSNNIFINNYNILFALIMKKDINVNMTLNEEIAKQTIYDTNVNLPGVVIESSYAIEDDKLIITKGKSGIHIDTESLLNKVKDRLNDINLNEDYIEIPVINKTPDEINIDKIHEQVYKQVQDAYYTKNPFTIYPEVEGVDFDVEAARAILGEEKEEYIIQLIITKPKVTIGQIGSEAFPDRLSVFTTRYDAGDVSRTTNLKIDYKKINGKVLLAGETFSYNQALGPRTIAAGYRNGKIYSAGEVVDGIGGGICQISSTLYNSVLMANLEIVERRNHQFVTSYLPAGRDATVVYGAIDFKFKNTRQYPIRIVASAQNGIATVAIYGIKEENEYTFSFSTRTVASIPFTTKYVEDSTLEIGTEKVKQKGANGLKTETYITKSLNGKVISTRLLSKDTYDAMRKIVLKGTKAVTTKPVTAPVETTTPTEEEKPTNTEKPSSTVKPEPVEKPSTETEVGVETTE